MGSAGEVISAIKVGPLALSPSAQFSSCVRKQCIRRTAHSKRKSTARHFVFAKLLALLTEKRSLPLAIITAMSLLSH